MTYLVIPDVHERFSVMMKILDKLEPTVDKVIFLGDLFDSFDGVTERTHQMIAWLPSAVEDEKYIFILGNHEGNYLPGGYCLRCSGYNPARHLLIQAKIGWMVWRKFVLGYVAGKYVLTHAGIHEKILEPPFTNERFRKMTKIVFDELMMHERGHELIRAGYVVGGTQPIGGLTWLRWNTEFKPIKSVNQIVGHTTVPQPQWKNHPDLNGGRNLNLDTNLKHCAIIHDDDTVEVIEVESLA